MASAGRLHTFGTNLDPQGLTEDVPRWLSESSQNADILDLNVGYAQFDGTPAYQNLDLGSGKVLYVNFAVHTSFSNGFRILEFLVGTHSSLPFPGTTRTIGSMSVEPGTVSSSSAPAGTRISVPIGTGAPLRRYIGVGIRSHASQPDEAGRFSAWLSTHPIGSNLQYAENFNWRA